MWGTKCSLQPNETERPNHASADWMLTAGIPERGIRRLPLAPFYCISFDTIPQARDPNPVHDASAAYFTPKLTNTARRLQVHLQAA